MKSTQFFSNFRLFSSVYEAGAMISLKNPKQFLLVLGEIGWRVISISTLSGTKVTSRVRLLHNFGKYLIRMDQKHGSLFVVKYLKACQIAVQRKVSGLPFKSLREIEPDYPLPRLSKSGLPVIIKLADRRAICVNGINTIRLYLSIFALYRIISAPVKAKLNTITDEFSGDAKFLVSVAEWSDTFVRLLPHIPRDSVSAFSLLPLLKSSPSSKVSWTGFVRDAWIIHKVNYLKKFEAYAKESNSMFLFDQLRTLSNGLVKYTTEEGNSLYQYLLGGEVKRQTGDIGQLQFKEEAAGKLRVFAMVDVWTQSFLSPLHNYLGKILSSLPNDGTYDQSASFRRSLEKSKVAGLAYSYDLSSATDRLPCYIQEVLLNNLFSNKLGSTWAQLLTNREYALPPKAVTYGIHLNKVKYAVGQPMGALSSWNMLAITHHLLLQLSASLHYKASSKWNEEYEILGDDLVIFNSGIAEQYLKLCDLLGISINLSKSLISENRPVFEFAKRFGVNSSDASAISWKQLFSQNSLRGRIAIAQFMMEKAISSKPMGVFWLAVKGLPWSKPNLAPSWFTKVSMISILCSLVKQRKLSSQWLIRAFMDPMNPTSSFGKLIDVVPQEHLISVISYYYKNRAMPSVMPVVPDKYGNYWNMFRPFYEAVVIEKINTLFRKMDTDSFFDDQVESWLESIVPSTYRKNFDPGLLFGIATVLHSMLNRFVLEADAFRSDLDVGFRGLDAQLAFVDKFEGILAMLDLPKASVERRVKINSDIIILEFIERAHRKHLEQLLFQIRKRGMRW